VTVTSCVADDEGGGLSEEEHPMSTSVAKAPGLLIMLCIVASLVLGCCAECHGLAASRVLFAYGFSGRL
jgi:hypothetical protein